MKYKVALIQLDTQNNYDKNLFDIKDMIKEAAKNGAKLISLPENINGITDDVNEMIAETEDGETTNTLKKLARDNKIWIHSGSFKEKSIGQKNYNTSLMINPEGEIVAKYRKLHLFDVSLNIDGEIRNLFESDNNIAGNRIVNVETEIGNLGFTICYDLRFPELFRVLALKGANIIFVPANFTQKTGESHWESLLRARAIENGCYILAAAQTGHKPKFEAYGHSIIIDPWGNVLAEADKEIGIVYANIDLETVDSIRTQVPSLKNRRKDVYEIRVDEEVRNEDN